MIKKFYMLLVRTYLVRTYLVRTYLVRAYLVRTYIVRAYLVRAYLVPLVTKQLSQCELTVNADCLHLQKHHVFW